MPAGKRSELVRVEAPSSVDDGSGGYVTTWSTSGQLWADVKPQRASEAERAGAERTLSVYLFQALAVDVRTAGVDPSRRLVWLDPVLGVERVFNVREVRTPKAAVAELEIVGETQ